MNFATLKTELAARGFSYLDDTRLGQYVNWGRAELDDIALWPYRMKLAIGSANTGVLGISDMGTIVDVQDTANGYQDLPILSVTDAQAQFGDLTVLGTPAFVYWDPFTSSLTAFPIGGTLRARYYRTTPDLGNDSDLPASPPRFHRLIVDIAAARAYQDSDNFGASQQLRVAIDRDLMVMRVALDTLTVPDGFVMLDSVDG